MLKDEIENLPPCPTQTPKLPMQPSSGLWRDPLHSIPEPTQTPKPGMEKEVGFKVRVETTPTKLKGRAADVLPHFRTPRTIRAPTAGRSTSHTETTPTKSVSKLPPMSSSRVQTSYSKSGNYAALSRGGLPAVVNTLEVPHFDLKEDPSFWIHHNVQVIIRVRPLNRAEISVQGYNRCVKQESAQNITWIGQPESRFTFDHVASETVDQEMLFRKAGLPMVENCLSGYNSCMFAYGQTGSGKTYTMLGDIDDVEFKPSLQRGMTPRIFEYLFARIRAEEESRRDDQLKYSCKCSFLEIYNEQITDLLNPSSTNLLLREDMRKGIYVENLSEFEVYSVSDILSLLAQGSLNRKVAATNMNMESSRSHSVFTCVIESKWERDSTTNLRFARLNLVDLAGSERQKTSGAEGERLKEAANINKSLSTLGHVIMVLVDVANGKIRHVPYRDSKLTFLLQDSLGGNSKTIIIANISPSTGCAAETLNTLKFAQRGKLIQNNAIVNEDSSGDVSALQHQIRLLKEELSAAKRQAVPRSLSFGPLSLQYNTEDHEDVDMEIDQPLSDDSVQFETEAVKMTSQQQKSLEKVVAGALRREQMAQTSIRNLEAEIEHLNSLVHQREEEARCSKMKVKFQDCKIQRMVSLLKGVLPVDSYLLEENASHSKEIQMLQDKVDRNPEVIRFAVENIRLSKQLKRYQDFYEEGEREILLSEISELRDKLIQHFESNIPIAPKELRVPGEKEKPIDMLKPAEDFLSLELELDILKIILKEERSSRSKADQLATCLSRELKLAEESITSTCNQYEHVNEQLKEAKSMIESLRTQQLLSANELEDLKQKNKQYVELLHKHELELVAFKQQTRHQESSDCLLFKGSKRDDTLFQLRINNMQASLEKAKMLNLTYQRDHAFQKANEEEMDVTRQQVEEETAQVILCLQEELSALQQQVQDCCWKEKEVESRLAFLETTLSQQQEAFNALTCENEALREQMQEKEKNVELISKEWELISSEIEGALTEGNEALIDASEQLDSICGYVPKKERWISEQVRRLVNQASEKELVIEDLNACLENANARLNDMECMLRSLKGAALAITESHQKECSEKEKEIYRLRSELHAKSMANLELKREISMACDEMRKTSKCATVSFIIVSRLTELNSGHLDALKHIELQLKDSMESNQLKDGLLDKCAAASEEAQRHIKSLRKELESTAEKSERQCREGMRIVKAHICQILATFGDFEDQCLYKMMVLSQKVEQVEQHVEIASHSWGQAKEIFEGELRNTTADVAKKTAEASCLFSKFQETQDIMKEADVMIKGLMIANETMKLEIKDLKRANLSLSFERDRLIQDIQDLHSLTALNDQQCHEHLQGLEMVISEARCSSEEAVLSMSTDISSLKSQLFYSTQLIQLWLEDIWCAIFVKDSVFSVQHLSYMGILLQALAGLNAENCLLNNRFSESDATISHLREQNIKSVQDLEAFKMLKGKLLADIEGSFDRVTIKENETEELSAKLRSFESKITDLQLQEELMLERSKYLGVGLANLVKDLNNSHSDALAALSEQEKCLRDSKEATISQEETLMMELSAKDLELVIMTSELQQLADEKAEMETYQKHLNNSHSNALAALLEQEKCLRDGKEATIYQEETLMMELSAKDLELVVMTSELQQLAVEKAEMETNQKDLNNTHSDALTALLEQEKRLRDSKEATISQEETLMMKLSSKDLELVVMTSELQQMADEKAEMETDQNESSTILEHIKKEFTTLSFTSNLLQQLLLERDAEVIQLQKEESGKVSFLQEELCQKSQELHSHFMNMNMLEEANGSLKNELSLLQLSKIGDLSLASSSVAKCLNLTEAAETKSYRMCALLNEKIDIVSDRLSQDFCGNLEAVEKIEKTLEPLDKIVEAVISENSALQAELLRKDEVLKGLLFDLSLLQESASTTKDQKTEIEELTASLSFKDNELEAKAQELDDVVAHVHELEAQIKEKIVNISLLERDLTTTTNAVELLSKEKEDLTSHVDKIIAAKVTLERDLDEKKKLVESLEIEIMNMENSISQANASIESLKSDLDEVSNDRDHLHDELRDMEEKLDTAEALAEEYEAIAMQAKQIAESNRIYGEEKEEEVKLLEKSVMELDRTIDVLENKTDILKEEAERLRLQREELGIELDSLNNQLHNLKSADSDIKRHLEEKEQNLQKALKHVQKLEKDLANKDTEISHCKAHITELNLIAELQASEYKKKFKALEAMAGQVKSEGLSSSHGKSCSSNKLEKNGSKPRGGSGSPFKCIGIGLAQQLKLEKDEDLTAERLRIQELEALAANRQKEIFVLNNRLAATESMTHDVIRDLLGVKLDMTNYVSLVDKQQVQKIAESAQLDNVDSKVKVEEISKLKKLLSDFVEERKGWLQEIERKQAELLASQLALEKLHQRDRSHTAENEVLKVDVEKYKKKVVELEDEVNKLYGQKNLHHQIHHHAKIKEENNILKKQNEELSTRLQKADTVLQIMKERLRAFNGKGYYEEKRLSNKHKEAEEERVQLAQELLGLCTSILKAAGIKKPWSDISVASAEEALEQLRCKFTSLERELENCKLKNRIEDERARLSEIIMQSPPPSRRRAEDNCTPPRRKSQSPFFSAVDR